MSDPDLDLDLDPDEPTVFPQALGLAVATASFARGRSPDEICAQLALDPARLADTTGRLPHGLVMRAWRELSAGTDDFGLRAARLVGRSGQSLVEYAITNAPDLRSALGTFVRLQHLLHGAAAHALDVTAKAVVFRFGLRPPHAAPHAIWDFLAATQVLRVRALLGDRGDPAHVALPRGPFEDEAAARALFRAPISYREPAAVHWPRALLDRPLPSTDPQLHYLLTRQLGGQLEEGGVDTAPGAAPASPLTTSVGNDVVIELRRVLRAAVLRGDASVGAAAQQLGISVRSLQRRLAERGTSFAEQLDLARKAVALALLAEHGSSVKHAALTAGFSQVAAFSRAFRRWTGQSPLAYLRGAAQPESAAR